MTDWEIRQGHAPLLLRAMPSESVQCVVTSPPYWGLRSYGTSPQIWGPEPCGRSTPKSEWQHDWGESITVVKGGAGQNKGLRNAEDYREARDTQAQTIQQGAFCRRCGAWRGELGSEPTIALYV